MRLTVGAKCAKFFLFILNAIFFLAGAILLGIGLWLKFDNRIDRYFQYSKSAPLYTSLGLAVVQQTAWAIFAAFGAFIFVVGFCGCFGAIKESRFLLGLYVIFISVIIAGELGGGIYAYIKFRDVSTKIEADIVSDLKTHYEKNSSLINDPLMKEFKCCGWNSYHDFNFTLTLPSPCCTNSSVTACSASMAPNVHAGCKSLISNLFDKSGTIFMGVGIGVAVVEVIVLASAIALYRAIGRK